MTDTTDADNNPTNAGGCCGGHGQSADSQPGQPGQPGHTGQPGHGAEENPGDLGLKDVNADGSSDGCGCHSGADGTEANDSAGANADDASAGGCCQGGAASTAESSESGESSESSESSEPAEPETEEERLSRELEERTADLKRVGAEYANYRRRAERDRQATIEIAKGQVASQLLPMADDLELARQHGDLEEGPLKTFGDKFAAVVKGLGVEKFGEPGDEFDPERHEAVQDTSSGDDKIVGTVLRPGYKMGERVLRTAMVIIADPE